MHPFQNNGSGLFVCLGKILPKPHQLKHTEQQFQLNNVRFEFEESLPFTVCKPVSDYE